MREDVLQHDKESSSVPNLDAKDRMSFARSRHVFDSVRGQKISGEAESRDSVFVVLYADLTQPRAILYVKPILSCHYGT